MTDGSVTLLSQTDGTTLEIKTFDAHDGQGLTLARPPACVRALLPAAKVLRSFAEPRK